MIYSCYFEGADLITRERQSEVAEELLRIGLKREYGIHEDEVIRNRSGKPSLKENRSIQISISHCDNAVTVILSKKRVGIDIEKVRSFNASAAGRILSSIELEELKMSSRKDAAFFRYWTLKESYIKALGCGFSYPVKKLRITFTEEKIISNRPYAEFHTMEGRNGYITSVCHLGKSETADEDLREIRITIP